MEIIYTNLVSYTPFIIFYVISCNKKLKKHFLYFSSIEAITTHVSQPLRFYLVGCINNTSALAYK